MKIAGENYTIEEVFGSFSTVPDCIVKGTNKIGSGHGEAKFYISNKDDMHKFYGKEGFCVKCIMLKSDLLNYMDAIKNEYFNPSYEYGAGYYKNRKNNIPLSNLWLERVEKIKCLSEVIEFQIYDQNQIQGTRGYVNSDEEGYELIRTIALPLCSYIAAYKLVDKFGEVFFYWRLFVDFDAIQAKDVEPLVFTYGKSKESKTTTKTNQEKPMKNPKNSAQEKEAVSKARIGQGLYREKLMEECPFCPITFINDERLLIASHIKPWAASNDKEKIDPKNGYMLSPVFDKLFDRGFITFTGDRRIHLSNMISPKNYERMGIKNNEFFQALPMSSEREEYLDFHHKSVFNGILD